MRLDAATDNLLQTRDLLISHFENQLLQLQDVRTALHETAKETMALAVVLETTQAKATPSTPACVGAISPMQGVTLERLFEPIGGLMQPIPEDVPPSPESVAELPYQEVEVLPTESLFEAEPVPSWEAVTPSYVGETPANGHHFGERQPSAGGNQLIVDRADLDPELEKATLNELNEALTRAFAQIATRHAHS